MESYSTLVRTTARFHLIHVWCLVSVLRGEKFPWCCVNFSCVSLSFSSRIFGFVARKSQSETENVCHLFAEHDPEQPASAIVNFVSKVMIGSHKK